LIKRLEGKPVIRINSTKRFQTILGFGGAITDAVVANAVSGGQVQLLVDQYFGPTGRGF
jgi:O-glycosyl hydrolase